jgi:hypothetical protein
LALRAFSRLAQLGKKGLELAFASAKA